MCSTWYYYGLMQARGDEIIRSNNGSQSYPTKKMYLRLS